MAEINLQRLNRDSKRITGATDASFINLLGTSKNNITFIYNNYGDSHNPFTYSSDGVYIGKNRVAGLTRAYYTKDLSTSLQFHTAVNAHWRHPEYGYQPQPMLIGDFGVLHLSMPGKQFTETVSTDLNFRTLDEALYSFGNINKVVEYVPTDNKPDGWDNSFGYVYGGDLSSDVTFTHIDASENTVNTNYSGYSFPPSTPNSSYGNASDGIINDIKDHLHADITSHVGKSIDLDSAWTQVLTNAYAGIISNVKWDAKSDPIKTSEASLEGPHAMLFGGGETINTGLSGPGAFPTPEQEDTWGKNTMDTCTGYKEAATYYNRWNIVEDEPTATAVQEQYAESNKDIWATNSTYTDDISSRVHIVMTDDLFAAKTDTSLATSVAWTGQMTNVYNDVSLSEANHDNHTYAYNVLGSLDDITYHPWNVWDEIRHKFDICDANFQALAANLNMTNTMVVSDVAGTLVPAAVSNLNGKILTVDASLREDLHTIDVSMSAQSAVIDALDANVSSHTNTLAETSTHLYNIDSSIYQINYRLSGLSWVDSSLSKLDTSLNLLNYWVDGSLAKLDTSINLINTHLVRTDLSLSRLDISVYGAFVNLQRNIEAVNALDVSVQNSAIIAQCNNYKKCLWGGDAPIIMPMNAQKDILTLNMVEDDMPTLFIYWPEGAQSRFEIDYYVYSSSMGDFYYNQDPSWGDPNVPMYHNTYTFDPFGIDGAPEGGCLFMLQPEVLHVWNDVKKITRTWENDEYTDTWDGYYYGAYGAESFVNDAINSPAIESSSDRHIIPMRFKNNIRYEVPVQPSESINWIMCTWKVYKALDPQSTQAFAAWNPDGNNQTSGNQINMIDLDE